MTEKLKPCPFCGDPMDMSRDMIRHLDQGNCPIGQQGWSPEYLFKWNTRTAPPPDPKAPDEALEERVTNIVYSDLCDALRDFGVPEEVYKNNPEVGDAAIATADCILAAMPTPRPEGDGVAAIVAERSRQVEVEGWTPKHDDQWSKGELAIAAAVYAAPGVRDGLPVGHRPRSKLMPFWPWSSDWFKPKDRRSNLVRAGALIAAEIDRLDRAAAPQNGEG